MAGVLAGRACHCTRAHSVSDDVVAIDVIAVVVVVADVIVVVVDIICRKRFDAWY